MVINLKKMWNMEFVIRVIDRKTKKIVQEYNRKSEKAADRLWCLALKNVNQLKYKLQFEEIKVGPHDGKPCLGPGCPYCDEDEAM